MHGVSKWSYKSKQLLIFQLVQITINPWLFMEQTCPALCNFQGLFNPPRVSQKKTIYELTVM